DSSQSGSERDAVMQDLQQGVYRLLFVSPERLAVTDFRIFLGRLDIQTFAIDEAHCISHWGHDFRPEYRQLESLREQFPHASLHAYTATATEQVRHDISKQLRLKSPAVLVGNFDRPNLNYRILPRVDLMRQVQEVLDRHKGEAGILYCIRRKDVDELTTVLRKLGCKALPYHAGLATEIRQKTQDAFAAEECDLVVATVAFGMGIDRSNVRFVLHAGMPKSLEHYQQETGRAGRDGLEAECVLLHSGSDFMTWKFLVDKSADEADAEPQFRASSMQHLQDIDRYCRGAVCRHKALVEHFGQAYSAPTCGACDLCLGDKEEMPEANIVAQKILSCVARVKEGFGVSHVASVLRGENLEAVRRRGHDQLSTFGLLSEHEKTEVRDWIYQLIGQGLLLQVGDDYPVLKLNAASWEILKSQRKAKLFQVATRSKEGRLAKSRADKTSWEGVDQTLFESLRALRKRLADEKHVPPYIIFSDATLREFARTRPSSLLKMRLVMGVGEVKLRDYGQEFLELILTHCKENKVSQDQAAAVLPRPMPRPPSGKPNPVRDLAITLFRENTALQDVMHQTQRSESVIVKYLCDFIHEEKPPQIGSWVPADVYERVATVARQVGLDRLKPIFIELNEKVSYEQIRIVVTHMEVMEGTAST
ncbi:MAG TPA: RecQ family ATP-dependent DNA helicase, partial [Gemmataceae bacterium]|nr:RecQ family ATP-dependent DNA helicase [Gemmataceae bacterium]